MSNSIVNGVESARSTKSAASGAKSFEVRGVKSESRSDAPGKVSAIWNDLCRDGHVLTGLLLSTSYSEKYKGRNMRPGEHAEVRVVKEPTDTDDKDYRTWSPELLFRAETDGREAVAFIWLGDEAEGDRTIYVAFSPLRKKRQFYRVYTSHLIDEGVLASEEQTGGGDRMPMSSYIRRKLYQLRGRGLFRELRKALQEHPGHRVLCAGISHGAVLAQASSFFMRLSIPGIEIYAATWNAYRWTNEEGSNLIGRVMGPRLLPMILSRRSGDERNWDSVAGFPPDWSPPPRTVMLDADTGAFLPAEPNSEYLDPSHLGLDFAMRMRELHFAKAAINATRAATKNALGIGSLGQNDGGENSMSAWDSDTWSNNDEEDQELQSSSHPDMQAVIDAARKDEQAGQEDFEDDQTDRGSPHDRFHSCVSMESAPEASPAFDFGPAPRQRSKSTWPTKPLLEQDLGERKDEILQMARESSGSAASDEPHEPLAATVAASDGSTVDGNATEKLDDTSADGTLESLKWLGRKRSGSLPPAGYDSYKWVPLNRGDLLPAGVVESGTADVDGAGGPAYVSRNLAGEPGALGLQNGAGPRRMDRIRCSISGYFNRGEVLVLGNCCMETWEAIQLGGIVSDRLVQAGLTLGGGDVCIARADRGNPTGAWWQEDVDGKPNGRRIKGFSHQPKTDTSSGVSDQEVQALVIQEAATELRIDVISSEGLNSPVYRFGDIAGSVLGTKSLKPYVVVSFLESSWTTGFRDAPSGTVSFEESVRFPLQTLPWLSVEKAPLLTFKVFDRREWQAWIGGDAFVGEGSIPITEELCSTGVIGEQRVEMMQGRKGHGWLTVYVSIGTRSLMSVDDWLGT